MLIAVWQLLDRAGGRPRRRRAAAQAPIESELTLITPVSKFIHDAALKAFAEYAKEKWNVTVKTNAIPAGTPVAYGRIVEWKGRPDADIFWGGESALFEKLAEQKLLQKVEICKEAWDSIPASIGKPKPIPLKDKDGYWIGTALEPYGLVYHPVKIKRLGIAEPKDWDDLLDPKLKGEVAQCAPTRSSSSNATYEVILSMYGEDKGWEWLKKLAANTGHFTARSRDVPTVVAKGEYAAGFAVPSYMAFEEKLAGFDIKFVAPKNAFVTPEPMAILAGARNPQGRARVHRVPADRARPAGLHGARPVPDHAQVQGAGRARLDGRDGRGVHRRRALLLRRRGHQRLRRGAWPPSARRRSRRGSARTSRRSGRRRTRDRARMKIPLQGVVKRFGATIAVDRTHLEIADGELFTLLGPSGCGKTTLLRLIAGFYSRPTRARSASASGGWTRCRPTSGTSAWCSRTTRCGRT